MENIILLYGSTGDLTFRKILPSLIELNKQNKLSKTKVVAIGRRDFNNESYYNFIKEHNENINIADLRELLSYLKMQITEEDDYKILNNYLFKNSNYKTKIYHYLAISSHLMELTLNNLNESSIIKNDNHYLVFEKPFGNNLDEALELINLIEKVNKKDNTFLVDHYLGKPFIDLLLKEKLLKNDFKQLNKIELVLMEQDGVLNRGPFYDKTGAVSDMFQSHILQMLSLLFINNKDNIRNQKIRNINNLSFKNILFGQYSGYLEENNIEINSKTETLFAASLLFDNKVSINVITGKKMFEKKSYIKLYFNDKIITVNIFPKTNILLNNEIVSKAQTKLQDYSNIFIALLNDRKELFVSFEEVTLMHKLTDEIKRNKKDLVIYNSNLNIKDIFKNFS